MPGGHHPPAPSIVPVDCLAFERVRLKDRLSDSVIKVIQASRRPSTTRIYETSWRTFSAWCAGHHVDLTSADIPDVLDFLNAGLARGLAPATLRQQVVALATVLTCEPQRSLTQNLHIQGFLEGPTNMAKPIVH